LQIDETHLNNVLGKICTFFSRGSPSTLDILVRQRFDGQECPSYEPFCLHLSLGVAGNLRVPWPKTAVICHTGCGTWNVPATFVTWFHDGV